MRLIGIISEYNDELDGKKFHDYKIKCDYQNKEVILNYLQKGTSIAVTMQVVKSLIKDDISIIGGVSYLTDGYWIWPNYLNFYVDKLSIELPSDFLNFISKNGPIKLINDDQKLEAINFLKLLK